MPTDPSDAVLTMILRMTRNLIARDKLRLIAALTEQLRDEAANPEKKTFRSLYGVLKGSGPVPSVEDIKEVRREMWGEPAIEEICEDATR